MIIVIKVLGTLDFHHSARFKVFAALRSELDTVCTTRTQTLHGVCVFVFFFSYQLLIGGRFMIRKLGFAADDRLLIINADDFGMTKGTNEAIVNLFEKTQ